MALLICKPPKIGIAMTLQIDPQIHLPLPCYSLIHHHSFDRISNEVVAPSTPVGGAIKSLIKPASDETQIER